MKMLKKGKLKFSNISGEGRDTGVRKKISAQNLLQLHSIETHTGRRKDGDFKHDSPTKKLYNLEIHALEFKVAASFPSTVL